MGHVGHSRPRGSDALAALHACSRLRSPLMPPVQETRRAPGSPLRTARAEDQTAGGGSNRRLTLTKQWKSTSRAALRDARGWGPGGFATENGAASGRGQRDASARGVSAAASRQLNNRGQKGPKKKFSANQQQRRDQDLHIKYNCNRAERSLL